VCACACAVDAVLASSPTSDCPVLDSDRDSTFDDFDLDNEERVEVAEMFQWSSDRDLRRSHQGQRKSESDADLAPFSIDIPSSRSVPLCLSDSIVLYFMMKMRFKEFLF